MFTSRKRKFMAIAAVTCLAVAGGAYAYWSGTGSGTGTASVGSGGTVTLAATITDESSPGTSVPVTFTAANATGSAIQVGDVSLVGVAADAGHSTCETDDFTMAPVTENHLVPAGATVEALPNDGSLAYANTGVSQDACKGATLTLSLSSN